MSKTVRIKRGLDIRLKGSAEELITDLPLSSLYAVKPTDFHGLLPKMEVKIGHEVEAGSPLFHDKYDPRIQFTSPVSGIVVEIRRGAKRRITEVRIMADRQVEYRDFGPSDPSTMGREGIIAHLLKSGLWPCIRQRPYDVIAHPDEQPKAIFISGMDSHPLAPNLNFVMKGQEEDFQAGIEALAHLTEGQIHLNVSADPASSNSFRSIQGVNLNTFKGPHPSGNIGVQIHHLDPINKGEVAWYLNPQDVAIMGRLFRNGKVQASQVVALTGSEVTAPQYFRILKGSPISSLTRERIKGDNLRFISGNVLTGKQVGPDGFLGFYHQQLSVLPEGDQPQFFLTKGWMGLGFDKFSLSHSYPTWLNSSKSYRLDTNLNGEKRAFVVTGQYEKVFPFDIYPVQLLKAILANDIDAMENLGIYEVGPEDFALCEYVCTSKISSQKIVRQGLDKLRAEFM